LPTNLVTSGEREGKINKTTDQHRLIWKKAPKTANLYGLKDDDNPNHNFNKMFGVRKSKWSVVELGGDKNISSMFSHSDSHSA